MRKYSLFSKGDVIRTNPEEGFYGIAVVLNDPRKIEIATGKLSKPLCHIAITPLIFQHKVTLDELVISDLKPLIFNRKYIQKDGKAVPLRKEISIMIYTNRNIADLPIIGNIDSSKIYDGELLFKPQLDRFYFCGEIKPGSLFGREAYLSYLEESEKI